MTTVIKLEIISHTKTLVINQRVLFDWKKGLMITNKLPIYYNILDLGAMASKDNLHIQTHISENLKVKLKYFILGMLVLVFSL